MKQTKNAENKKKGNKITFRVNVIEDRELIRYIDDNEYISIITRIFK